MGFVVENEVVLELKAIPDILPVHEAQILSYLRFGSFCKELLVNFHVRTLKNGLRRLVL